jgi:hypothetical protein
MKPNSPDSETLKWHTPEEQTPPVRSCLFVRLERITDGLINFATSIYDPERGFLYLRLEDIPLSGHGSLPSQYAVTHWALSKRTHEAKTAYAWLEEPETGPPPAPNPPDPIIDIPPIPPPEEL